MAKEKICGIYLLTIKTDSFRSYYYVGQSQNCEKRILTHLRTLRSGNHHSVKVQNIFNKYNNISFEILEKCMVEDLCSYEQWWIDEMYGSKYCMNISKDAKVFGRGLPMSEDAKVKRKLTWANKPPEEIQRARQNISKGLRGREWGPEARMNASIAAKARGISEETRAKLDAASHARKGSKLSEETRTKMSDARKGSKNHNFGKIMSEEQRLKISLTKTGCKNPHKGNVTKWSDARRERFDAKKKLKEGLKHEL